MKTKEVIFEKINSDFKLLAKIAMTQFFLCRSMLTGDGDMVEIEKNESIIDSIEVKLRSEMISAIVLHTPRAIDLRKIIAYYDMTGYIERICDHLINVATELEKVNHKGRIISICQDKLDELYTVVETMTQNAIFSFACEDNLLARKTILDDDAADVLNKEVMKMLNVIGAEQKLDSSEIEDILMLGALASNLERIGDNATNIAESAIYLTEGKVIRHKENE